MVKVRRKKLPFSEEDVSLFISKFSTGSWATMEDFDPEKPGSRYSPGLKTHISSDHAKKHLDGKLTLGSYVISPKNECKFLVIDFDIDGVVAKKTILNSKDKKARVEREKALEKIKEVVSQSIKLLNERLYISQNQILIEKSGLKGFHIWMFFAASVPAPQAYKLTRILQNELGLKGFEFFPKQPSINEGGLGSLIKIPLGIHRGNGERCLFVDENFEPHLDQWGPLREVVPIAEDQFNNLLKLSDTEVNKVEEDSVDDITTIGGSIDLMIERCEVLQGLKRRAETPDEATGVINLNHAERLFLLSLFRKFGDIGKIKLHQFLEKTHNYDHNKTEAIFNSATIGPMRCDTVRGHGICPKECAAIADVNGKSPIKLAFDGSRTGGDVVVLNSLAGIENAILCHRRIRVDFVVSALVDSPYHSIKKATFRACDETTCPNYAECTCEEKDVSKVITIGGGRKEHIQMYGVKDREVMSIIRSKVEGCGSDKYLSIENMEKYIVQPFFAANVLSQNIGKDVLTELDDDNNAKAAKEQKDYLAFYLGNTLETSKVYRGWGNILSNPQNQSLTVIFDKVEPIHGNIENFAVNEINRDAFEVFKSMTLEEKINDLRENVAFIRGRDELIFTILLTYFSALDIEFNCTDLNRGWVESVIIGDTGQAKSRLTERLIKYFGLGHLEGSNVTFAGLVGGIVELQRKRFLHWGMYPRCNKGLIFLDEIQNFPPEIWTQLRTVRSTGIATIRKIASGDHEAKVRLICAANPKFDRDLATFKYGCLSLNSILQSADIRRFDIACFMSRRDLDQDYANVLNSPDSDPVLPPETWRQAIMWMWSRKKNQIHISREVTIQILKDAKEMGDLYGGAATVPLCNPADMRESLARLVVSCAGIHMRTKDYITLEPTLEDCAIVKKLLISMYSHPNVALDCESRERRRERDLDVGQLMEIKSIIKTNQRYKKVKKVVEGFVDMGTDGIRPNDLMHWAEAKPEEIASIITLLSKYRMISMGKGGAYKSQPKLQHLHQALSEEGDDGEDLL